DPPLALDPVDDRRVTGLADVNRLHRHRPGLRAGDPERAEAPLVLCALRLLDRRDGDRGVDPLGEVPETLAPDATRDRDLAAVHQSLQHLRDVAVVRPAARGPGDGSGVRKLARAQRPRVAQALEDVAPEAVVLAQPRSCVLVA